MIPTITERMIRYNGTDVRRIDHALKVTAYASLIAELEGLEPALVERITLAAILHDIGIHEAAAKHGSTVGKYQELEGPPVATRLMGDLAMPPFEQERICFLIGHHHTLGAIDGIDFQVLVEADYLVNATEDDLSANALRSLRAQVFRTRSGTALFDSMYADRLAD